MINNKLIHIRDPFKAMDKAFANMDDAFANMDTMWLHLFNQPTSTLKKMTDNGISVIGRPHNVITLKDKDGKTIGNKIEVVTTPFKKDEVSVDITNGMLNVKCETVKKDEVADEEDIAIKEYEIHHGISSQTVSFQLKLSDKVDIDAITAKNEDGILTIELPFIKEDEKKDDEVRKITVL